MTRLLLLRPSRSSVLPLGGVVAAVLVVAGCFSPGEGSGAGPTPSATISSSTGRSGATSTTTGPTSTSTPVPTGTGSSSAADLPAGAKALSVTITGKQVRPAPGVVELRSGQVLRLTVTSDHADELHAHGFEKEAELVAGEPTTLDLVTDQPGSYEVETHHPALRLLKVQVR